MPGFPILTPKRYCTIKHEETSSPPVTALPVLNFTSVLNRKFGEDNCT